MVTKPVSCSWQNGHFAEHPQGVVQRAFVVVNARPMNVSGSGYAGGRLRQTDLILRSRSDEARVHAVVL